MFAGGVHHINQRTTGFLVALTVLLTPLLSASNASVRAAPAYTEVGGPIISDTTWTLANSPYIVVANVEVWQGVTLTIQPGVVIKFNKDKLLQVNGMLIARGTAASQIIFTSNQASPKKGDWKNIGFTDSSIDATLDAAGHYTGGSILEHCVVEYGGNGVAGAVQTDNASPLIDHCAVRNNHSTGIHGVSSYNNIVIIRNNTVSGNSAACSGWECSTYGGIRAVYGMVMRNIVSGNSATCNGGSSSCRTYGGGIYAEGSTVMDNIVSGNSATVSGHYGRAVGGGIYAVSSTVTGNTVNSNSAMHDGGGIYAVSSTVTGNIINSNSANWDGGGISAYSSPMTDNVVSDNAAGWEGGGIFAVSSPVTGNTVSGNLTSKDGGGIHAEYSPVTGNAVSSNSTSYNGGGIYAVHDSVTGNTVSGNSAAGSGGGIYSPGNGPMTGNTVSGNLAGGSGGGIYAMGSTVMGNTVIGNSASYDGGGICVGTSTVFSNSVTANSLSTATGRGSGVYFSGSGDFLYNTIVGNTVISPTAVIGGVAIYGAPQFHYNNLYGNSNYDVVVLSSQDISGTNNYWGTVATVDILAHVYDWYDDSARGRLLYIPYLQDPDPNAPVPPPRNLRVSFMGGLASLSWDAIPSTTTGYGYKVYYDTDASGPPYNGTGAAQGNSPVDVGNVTHSTLSGLGSGVHIAITAYDTQGRESWYSNEGSSPRRIYLPTVQKR